MQDALEEVLPRNLATIVHGFIKPPMLWLNNAVSELKSYGLSLKIENVREPLEDACKSGHIEMVQLLLAYVPVWASMHYEVLNAMKNGHSAIVRLLLEHSPHPNDINNALCQACDRDTNRLDFELIDWLIAHGANPNQGMYSGCTRGDICIVKEMIDRGANQWDTGLHIACEGGHIDLINLMIMNGAAECDYCGATMDEHISRDRASSQT